MITAIEFGKKYASCEEAMIWRHSLPASTTQAEAYLLCPRGDWLVWQLMETCVDQEEIEQALQRAATKIVARAIRRSVKSLVGNKKPCATKYRGWARQWLGGEDRSAFSAKAAHTAYAAAYEYAHAAYAAYAASAAAIGYASASATYAVTVSSYATAATAAAAGDASVLRIKELRRQARDIRSEILAWPGKE